MTALQKLIKQFEEIKDSNIESSIDVGFAIALAKSMLEKEKEVITSAYNQGKHDTEDIERGRTPNFLTVEDYYKETFNTKEK